MNLQGINWNQSWRGVWYLLRWLQARTQLVRQSKAAFTCTGQKTKKCHRNRSNVFSHSPFTCTRFLCFVFSRASESVLEVANWQKKNFRCIWRTKRTTPNKTRSTIWRETSNTHCPPCSLSYGPGTTQVFLTFAYAIYSNIFVKFTKFILMNMGLCFLS